MTEITDWTVLGRAHNINELVTYFHSKSKAAGWWEEDGRDLTSDKYVHATKLMLIVTEVSTARFSMPIGRISTPSHGGRDGWSSASLMMTFPVGVIEIKGPTIQELQKEAA